MNEREFHITLPDGTTIRVQLYKEHGHISPMATPTPQQISDKIGELTEQFHHYVFDHPEIMDAIPDKAVLVFLDPNDPDFNRANIEIAQNMPKPPGPLVYIEMRKQVRVVEQIEWTPQIKSLPLAA